MLHKRYSGRTLTKPSDAQEREANYIAKRMGVKRNGPYRLEWKRPDPGAGSSDDWTARRGGLARDRFDKISGARDAAISLEIIGREMLSRSTPWDLNLHERVQPIFEGLDLLEEGGNSLNDLGLAVYYRVMDDCVGYLASEEAEDDFYRPLFKGKHRMGTKQKLDRERQMNALIAEADAKIEQGH